LHEQRQIDAACDDDSVEPGVWRYARASRVRVIVDAADYFDLMQQAMLKARQRVLLIGWDFDTRIHLTQGRRWWQKPWRRGYPARLGSFIPWLTRHRKGLEIRILKWGVGVLKFLARGTMALDLLRWFPHRRIDFKFDTAHPIGCSHHQKIAVIDDRLAVCGGIDMADRRWDTRAHRATDPARRRPGGRPYGPWHDVTMMMEGPIAGVLDDLGRHRWERAGGKPLAPLRPSPDSAWPDRLEAHFEDVEIGVARTRAEYRGENAVHEVEKLFLTQIARARRFIYAENQYFASRAVAEAISARLVEPDPPEIVIVHPASAEGWIEATAMDPARAQLVRAIREIDRHDRFHLYTPHAGETPIYVHAKLMIVDDEILRIGSANFNNRSLGLDGECDVFIDCARPGNGHACAGIAALRRSLLAEHCGIGEDEVGSLLERTGSMAAMIASLGDGRTRHLRPFHPPELGEIEAALADREAFDPEEPAELFQIVPPGRGLFRPGSLLARARNRVNRKRRAR
jgi:phosphatidylserine/phosphatidylglycerophosphate/cardiolipin synthase-like enzyme